MAAGMVANEGLREMVEVFKREGLPQPVSMEDAGADFTEPQKSILGALYELGEQERAVVIEGGQPEKDSEWWQVRERAREKFQEAILNGLMHLGFVQRHAVMYGAIPDPKEGWKYYLLPDLTYACWNCGAEVMVKDVALSVHYKEFDGPVGGGEVRHKLVPYCPNCEAEPPDDGVIKESVVEALVRDIP